MPTIRALTPVAIYRGEEGWNGRFIAAAAADFALAVRRQLLGGTQRFTPRLQFVASPPTENLDIPNEDARSVDLEDSNLFALNRFNGYDRWEDGVRVTYGADWAVDFRGVAFRTDIGQSYRLSSARASCRKAPDCRGAFPISSAVPISRVGRRLSLVHRFRIDKESLALRRNEVDATFGGRQTYASIGYLRLDRDIDPAIEDLRDREEVRLGGRIRFAGYWSIFGSAVVDLTDRREDPLSIADGLRPGSPSPRDLYDDECIELGVTWRRDYETTGDAIRGDTFLIRVALKNLGR